MNLRNWVTAWLGAELAGESDKIKLIGFVACLLVTYGEVVYASHDTVAELFGVSKSQARRLRGDAIRAGMLVPTGEYLQFGTAGHLKIEKLKVAYPGKPC